MAREHLNCCDEAKFARRIIDDAPKGVFLCSLDVIRTIFKNYDCTLGLCQGFIDSYNAQGKAIGLNPFTLRDELAKLLKTPNVKEVEKGE